MGDPSRGVANDHTWGSRSTVSIRRLGVQDSHLRLVPVGRVRDGKERFTGGVPTGDKFPRKGETGRAVLLYDPEPRLCSCEDVAHHPPCKVWVRKSAGHTDSMTWLPGMGPTLRWRGKMVIDPFE
jgi:hypothetical protein